MTNKKKKTKKRKQPGRKRQIAPEIIENMFIEYVNNKPLAKIARENNISKQRLSYLAQTDNWHERKEKIHSKVSDQVDDELVKELIKSQSKQLEAVGMLMATIYNDIEEDYKNQGVKGYERKIQANSTLDVDRVVKTLYFIINNGMEKSDVSVSSKDVSSEKEKTDFNSSEKAQLLKGLANKLVVVKNKDDDEMSGNA